MEKKNDHWLRVTTSPGMFSSEYAICLKLADGRQASFFADKELIRESRGESLLKVTLVSGGANAVTTRVLLPFETFETASRWVDVPREWVRHDTEQR